MYLQQIVKAVADHLRRVLATGGHRHFTSTSCMRADEKQTTLHDNKNDTPQGGGRGQAVALLGND